MQRFRRVLRLARHAAFWSCCGMAVASFALMVCTRRCAIDGYWFDGQTRSLRHMTVGTGFLSVTYRTWSPGGIQYLSDKDNGIEFCRDALPWTLPLIDEPLNPATATRVAFRESAVFSPRKGVWGFHILIPLFALANVFALWPAIRLWRRWRWP